MTPKLPYAELKTITKEKRRNAHLRQPDKTKERINDIVMRATTDNPVSVLQLSKCSEFARHCLMLGADDNDAIKATRTYIQQINGNPVG